MYRRNREFGITKTNHIVLVTSVGQTVSSVFRCLSIAGKPYSVSLVCCCSQWLPILLFQVNPSAWISTSGSPATLSVQRKWQTFGRNDANAEHDACHTFRVASGTCVMLCFMPFAVSGSMYASSRRVVASQRTPLSSNWTAKFIEMKWHPEQINRYGFILQKPGISELECQMSQMV